MKPRRTANAYLVAAGAALLAVARESSLGGRIRVPDIEGTSRCKTAPVSVHQPPFGPSVSEDRPSSVALTERQFHAWG
jgi:hypothetical protein